jgi:hypothetical protein
MVLLRALLVLVVLFGLAAPVLADDTFVRGYTKRDGSYVAPHWRSAPDSSYNNNWSTSPNVNPYTGPAGHSRAAALRCATEPAGAAVRHAAPLDESVGAIGRADFANRWMRTSRSSQPSS